MNTKLKVKSLDGHVIMGMFRAYGTEGWRPIADVDGEQVALGWERVGISKIMEGRPSAASFDFELLNSSQPRRVHLEYHRVV